MDSINRQQPEENYKDLHGTEAGEKIKALATKNNTCFFCTDIQTGQPLKVRPMSVQKVDEEGNFWFLSAIDSHKNEKLKHDSKLQLIFIGTALSIYLSF